MRNKKEIKQKLGKKAKLEIPLQALPVSLNESTPVLAVFIIINTMKLFSPSFPIS